jgi:hypothetical protein
MILQNITRAIRTQNWFAVALEFLIVILGVVIGFQISAWNEARLEQQREAAILCRLDEEFDRIEADVREHLNDAEATYAEALVIAAAARRGFEVEDLDRLTRGAVTLRAPPAGSATYDQLVSSGELGLIRSAALRSALTDFGEHFDRHQAAGTMLSNMLVESAGPVVLTAGLSRESFSGLDDSVRSEMEAYLGGREFFLAAEALPHIALANLQWKQGSMARVETVRTLLTAETAHCAMAS